MSIANRILFYVVRILWVGICGYFFIKFYEDKDKWQNSEIIELFYYEMMLLTIPSGYVIALILGGVLDLLDMVFQCLTGNKVITLELYYVLIWISMVFGGYYQWFVYLPRKVKSHRAG